MAPELSEPSQPRHSVGGPQAPLPSDVSAGSVYAEGILAVVRRGIMPPVSLDPDPGADPSAPAVRGFAPGRTMSRGDVAAPLVRLWQVLDQECPTTAAAPFEDIDDPQVAADAGCLRGIGVTAGTTATTYSPERPVTRAEAASLLIRVWRLLGRDCPADGAPPFDDVAADSVHYDSILCLRALGITAGTSASTFSPGNHVSRAEFATMLTRLHNLINPPEPDPEAEAEESESEQSEPEAEQPEPDPEAEAEESESEQSESEAEQPEPESEVEAEESESEQSESESEESEVEAEESESEQSESESEQSESEAEQPEPDPEAEAEESESEQSEPEVGAARARPRG